MWLPENSLLIQVYINMHCEKKCQKVQFGRFRIMLELTFRKKFQMERAPYIAIFLHFMVNVSYKQQSML